MERGTAELTDAEVVLGYRDRLKEARLLEARLQEDEAAGAPLGLELKEERQALRTLPENDQKIIRLRYFQNKTQTETAEILNMTQVQVSRRERKILLQIRQLLAS